MNIKVVIFLQIFVNVSHPNNKRTHWSISCIAVLYLITLFQRASLVVNSSPVIAVTHFENLARGFPKWIKQKIDKKLPIHVFFYIRNLFIRKLG